MTLASKPTSIPDLTSQILAMAKTGVYRQSLFEALRPLATQRQIRAAIAQAKQFGLYTVPALRDQELGTYYQVEGTDFEAFQQAAKTLTALSPTGDLAEQMITPHRAMRAMLTTVAGCSLGLGLLGGWCFWDGQAQAGRLLWLGALVAGGLWGVQRAIAKRVM
ncbi:MAG TPA: hypothetical protein IGR64_07245 [Leptolyngbyaceae cyanobacterium M65_K2018_010]|nr:hypothetical protein [Leptolyngbyaceae cyanobacterium M65_K2018_010]